MFPTGCKGQVQRSALKAPSTRGWARCVRTCANSARACYSASSHLSNAYSASDMLATSPMPAPLVIADVPWLLYRSFFALPKSIADEQGRPVNALLGTVNALLSLID